MAVGEEWLTQCVAAFGLTSIKDDDGEVEGLEETPPKIQLTDRLAIESFTRTSIVSLQLPLEELVRWNIEDQQAIQSFVKHSETVFKIWYFVIDTIMEDHKELLLSRREEVLNAMIYHCLVFSVFPSKKVVWTSRRLNALSTELLVKLAVFCEPSEKNVKKSMIQVVNPTTTGVVERERKKKDRIIKLISFKLDSLLDQLKIKQEENFENRNDKVLKYIFNNLVHFIKPPLPQNSIAKLTSGLLVFLNSAKIDTKLISNQIVQHLVEVDLLGDIPDHFKNQILERLLHSLSFKEDDLTGSILDTVSKYLSNINERVFLLKSLNLVMNAFIYQFTYISEVELLKIYFIYIGKFSKLLEIQLVPHLKGLMPHLYRFLEIYENDSSFCISVIELMQIVVINCWPRMKYYKDSVLKSVLSYYINVTLLDSKYKTNYDTIHSAVVKLIILLCHCQPKDEIVGLLKDIELIQRVFNDVTSGLNLENV